jgi:hypothetical protein
MPGASSAPLDALPLERSGDIRDFVSIQDGRHNLKAAGDVIWWFDQGCTGWRSEAAVDKTRSQCIGVSP